MVSLTDRRVDRRLDQALPVWSDRQDRASCSVQERRRAIALHLGFFHAFWSTMARHRSVESERVFRESETASRRRAAQADSTHE